MLKVIVELHPYGDEQRRKEIHALYIANVGADGDLYNYNVWSDDPRMKKALPKADACVKHRRGEGALKLVKLAIDALEEAQCRTGNEKF